MSCSKCCGFKPFFGKVDYVIRDYDPKEDFNDYIVPTWWINRKRKVAWFLVSKEGGKSLWVPLLFGAFINKILTRCGEILPENGQIEFKEGEGIVFACDGSKLTFSLAIPILAEYGGTGFTEYKLGDLLVGNLDGTLSKLAIGEKGKALGVKDDGTLGYIDIVQKLNCSEDPVTENALTRWNKDGKCLKDSKTTQDDNGTTYTRSSTSSYLMHQVENLSNKSFFDAVYEAVVQSLGGNPIFRLIRRATQTWTLFSEKQDNSFRISGVNEKDPSEKGDFFQILTNGVIIGGNQTRFAARLAKTPNFAPNTWFGIGSNLPFQTIFDIDGTKNSAGLFYPGNGSGGEAYYTTKYTNVEYLIGCQFILDTTSDQRIRYDFRTVYTRPDNTVIAEFPLHGMFLTSFQSVNQIVRLTKESVVPNGQIKIRVNIHGGRPYINTLFPEPTVFENYFGVQILL